MSRSRQLFNVAATVLRDGPVPLLLARRAIREYAAIQRTWELQSLIAVVRRLRPAAVLEIGTHKGGTLVCWIAVARADAHIISVDLPQEIAGFGAGEGNFETIRPLLRAQQKLTTISGDSHVPETLVRVKAALAGSPVDVLWIDGDHSYAGVKADAEMYGPLVRPGGVIAFHDIHGSAAWPDSESHVYWEDTKSAYRTREFIAEPEPGRGMGIGVRFV